MTSYNYGLVDNLLTKTDGCSNKFHPGKLKQNDINEIMYHRLFLQ